MLADWCGISSDAKPVEEPSWKKAKLSINQSTYSCPHGGDKPQRQLHFSSLVETWQSGGRL